MPDNASMEPDTVADINALLNLGVGDPYRLEHIKQAYVKNKTLWDTDRKYLEFMKEKYLTRKAKRPPKVKVAAVGEDVTGDHIYCWNCGKKSVAKGNFCTICGSPLYEIGVETEKRPEPAGEQGGRMPGIVRGRMRIIVTAGVAILIASAIVLAYSQGALDGLGEVTITDGIKKEVVSGQAKPVVPKSPGQEHSKCGAGTVLDPGTNRCVLG